MNPDASPTARALLALELIQNQPGITAQRLADRLEVSDRAARRYVAILREAEIPIESVRGHYGGYRVGRGLRLPPLSLTAAEALGLVMAVLDGHHQVSDPTDPVGSAQGKIVRAASTASGGSIRSLRPSFHPATSTLSPSSRLISRRSGTTRSRCRSRRHWTSWPAVCLQPSAASNRWTNTPAG